MTSLVFRQSETLLLRTL